MDSLCTVFVDKLISRSMWASTHTSTCLLNKSHLKTHFSAPYCWHQFRGIPWATPQIEGRVLKRRQHLRCVVRCMSLYVALLPALPTPRTPLIVGSNRKVSHVDGEREGGGDYRTCAYFLFIQHKSHEVLCSPDVTISCWHDAKVRFGTPWVRLLQVICGESATNL